MNYILAVTSLLLTAFIPVKAGVAFRRRNREMKSMRPFAPKKILCPIDLSPASHAVLSWARELAQVFDSEVEVLYAYWSEAPRYFTEQQIGTLQSEVERQLLALRQELSELASKILGARIRFTTSVVEGHAVEVILKSLKTTPPDLVVMGSHGRSGVARFLLGSVAENVVHEAQCPVLIVKGAEIPADQRRVRSILCPVNLTEGARARTELAADLAAAFGAELSILHAVEGSASRTGEQDRAFCEWIPEEARSRCHVSEITKNGSAAEQIILFARQEKVDLIVLGAAHRAFLDTTTLGQTTVQVMRHSPGPVLLVPHDFEARKEKWDSRKTTAVERG